jgi:hypothetical protein
LCEQILGRPQFHNLDFSPHFIVIALQISQRYLPFFTSTSMGRNAGSEAVPGMRLIVLAPGFSLDSQGKNDIHSNPETTSHHLSFKSLMQVGSPDLGRACPGSRSAGEANHPFRGCALTCGSPFGLPIPSPLPLCPGDLCGRNSRGLLLRRRPHSQMPPNRGFESSRNVEAAIMEVRRFQFRKFPFPRTSCHLRSRRRPAQKKSLLTGEVITNATALLRTGVRKHAQDVKRGWCSI